MKLSVKSKVANGLVICLLVPRVGDSVADVFTHADESDPFSANDAFDLSAEQDAFAVVKVMRGADATAEDDPSGGDPSGGDPSGGDPGCDPSGGVPTLYINAPIELVTAEDGSSDLVEVSINPPPRAAEVLYFTSGHVDDEDPSGGDPSGGDPSGGDPSGGMPGSPSPIEAYTVPSAVVIQAGSCAPQPVWVVGKNDGMVDGDAEYAIEIRDSSGAILDTIPGVNLDNDDYDSVAVDMYGPSRLAEGEEGVFTARIANLGDADLTDNTLRIRASDGLDMNAYAASYLSGAEFSYSARLRSNGLVFRRVNLPAGDMILLTINAELAVGGPSEQRITASFKKRRFESDDDQRVTEKRP